MDIGSFLDNWAAEILSSFALIASIYSLYSARDTKTIQYAMECAQKKTDLLVKYSEVRSIADSCLEKVLSALNQTKFVAEEVANKEGERIFFLLDILHDLSNKTLEQSNKLEYLANSIRDINVGHKIKKKQSLITMDYLNDSEAEMERIKSMFNKLSSSMSSIKESYTEYLQNPD